MSKNNGGSAFPFLGSTLQNTMDGTGRTVRVADIGETPGMSLRDYFAAKVMQGLLAGSADKLTEREHAEPAAQAAYFMADAMLKERAK